MLSRALRSAAVMLLIGSFAGLPAQAQNLEAGKAPSQIFAGTCSVCHKSPRGLLKTVPAGSLPGYLRQHYTTSSDMASLLSAYLVSNGATDTRYGVVPPKQKDAKPEPATTPVQAETRPGHRPRPGVQEAAKPDADGLAPDAGPAGRTGRNAKRLARPTDNPEAATPAAEGQTPATADSDNPATRGKGKQRLGRKGRPIPETPANVDASKETAKGEPHRDEPAKGEATTTEAPKSDAAKTDGAKSDEGKAEASKSDVSKPAESSKAEGTRPETGKSEVPLRADPVPPVTPAPKAAEGDAKPAHTATPAPGESSPGSGSPAASDTPAANVTASGGPASPSAGSSAVTASAPAPAAGPPAPPISQ